MKKSPKGLFFDWLEERGYAAPQDEARRRSGERGYAASQDVARAKWKSELVELRKIHLQMIVFLLAFSRGGRMEYGDLLNLMGLNMGEGPLVPVCVFHPALDWIDVIIEDVSNVVIYSGTEIHLHAHPDEMRFIGFRICSARSLLLKLAPALEHSDGRIRVYDLILAIARTKQCSPMSKDNLEFAIAMTIAAQSHVDADLLNSIPKYASDERINLDLDMNPPAPPEVQI